MTETSDILRDLGNMTTLVCVEKFLWSKFKANEHLLKDFKKQFTFTQENLDKMTWQKPTDHDYVKCLAALAVLLPQHARIEPDIKKTNKYKIVQKTVRNLINA